MKYMNDHDIDRAWRMWQLHPVLGPAVRTVQNLKDMADANSDGWAYWRKPVQAAAKVIDLIERDGTSRYAYDEERADATAEEYKRALRPLKAFRTRMLRDERQGQVAYGSKRYNFNFAIVEPLEPGMSGELWVAKLALADAVSIREDAYKRYSAAQELERRAYFAVREAQDRIDAARYLDQVRALHEQHGDDYELARLALLATPGIRVWLRPESTGLGRPGTSLGLAAMPDKKVNRGWGWALVRIRPDGGRLDQDDKRLYAIAVTTVADAAEYWWIVSADGRHLVGGGSRDRDRVLALRDEKHPVCLVQQGAQFMPEAELRAAGVEPVREDIPAFASIPEGGL